MDNCPIRNRHVLPHANQVSCSLCYERYPMECISIDPHDLQRMHEESDWYYPLCLIGLFPFNHIEEEDLFIAEINKIEICPETIKVFDGMLFNAFEVNEDQFYTPLYKIDLDVNYYNSTSSHLGTNCNYYYYDHFEITLKTKCIDIKTRNTLSIYQFNTRSLRAKLPSFEICLNNTNYNFSVMELSETLLRDYTYNYILYNIW